MVDKRQDVRDILRKHSARIEGQIKTSSVENVNFSSEYTKFKAEMAPDLGRYERWCTSLGSVIKLKVAKKDEDKINEVVRTMKKSNYPQDFIDNYLNLMRNL